MADDTVFTAPRCEICQQPKHPELLNVTAFDDELPRWVIGWLCLNVFQHDRLLPKGGL